MVCSSLTVEVIPRFLSQISSELEAMNGVEIHGVEGNKIVVTVEAETVGASHRTASQFIPLEGVINVNLVYTNFEDDPHLKAAH